MPSFSLTLNVEPLSKIPQGGEPLNLSSDLISDKYTGLHGSTLMSAKNHRKRNSGHCKFGIHFDMLVGASQGHII